MAGSIGQVWQLCSARSAETSTHARAVYSAGPNTLDQAEAFIKTSRMNISGNEAGSPYVTTVPEWVRNNLIGYRQVIALRS